MTVALMSILTRRQIADLNKASKAELRAYIANKLAILIGNADLIVDRGYHDKDVDLALVIAKSGRETMKEIDELLADRDPDAHLGAGSEKHQQ